MRSQNKAREGAEPEIHVRREGRMLRITLNRPRAINALTPGMMHSIEDALTDAESDPSVEVVFVDGAGERGLCAGGDITMTVSARPEDLIAFWEHEYLVDLKISRFPKPYVAVMDGITMGGGIGISAHGNIRIVTERSRLSLPEVRIGFIPDVGGSLLLARAPGETGVHLALTAGDLGVADAIYTGFADNYVPSDRIDALREALASGSGSVTDIVTRFSDSVPESALVLQREWIDAAYAAETVAEIVERLRARPEPEAGRAAETIEQMSPNAVVIAHAAIRRARELDDLEAVLVLELQIGEIMIATPDMKEGVRAQIIDKDGNPKWIPATIAEVDTGWVSKTVGGL